MSWIPPWLVVCALLSVVKIVHIHTSVSKKGQNSKCMASTKKFTLIMAYVYVNFILVNTLTVFEGIEAAEKFLEHCNRVCSLLSNVSR